MHRYGKQFSAVQRLKFKYSPPFTSLDDQDIRRPKTLYPNEPTFFASAYYYWWLFLRLNDCYMSYCESRNGADYAQLYSDFGDIRSDDFVRWWIERGAQLFCEPEVADQIEVHYKTPQDVDHVRDLLISVPLTGEYEALVSQFRTILKGKIERYNTVYAQPISAKYPMRRDPKLPTLQLDYQIALARRQHPSASHYDLAETVGLYGGVRPKSDKVLDQANVDKVYKSLKRSELLIEWVGRGIFPVTDKPSAAELDEWGFGAHGP